jgi:predicted DNA-binding protein (MmcQ/YjbR family)
MVGIQARLRAFALSLPGACEEFPWEERVAKVDKKVFVFFGHDDETEPSLITVKLVESHGHAVAIEGAAPSGYGLARAGWVNVPVQAEGVTPKLICDWIEESYRIVAPKRLVAELDRHAASTVASGSGRTGSVPKSRRGTSTPRRR